MIFDTQGFEPFRENVVFLIDAQPAMFEETTLADSLVRGSQSA